MSDSLLEVEGITAGYETNVVLRDVSLDVDEGEVVSIVGRNGAGKTTTLRTIMGQLAVDSGHIRYRGEEITNAPPNEVYRRGIGLVPEHREIFPDLTVEENLEVGGVTTDDNWLSVAGAYDYFPRLRERRTNRGAQLSGGEQQMLAIARSLRGATDLLLLDEPTEGLAPQIVESILDIIDQLRADGVTVLLVEQNLQAVLEVADRHYVLADGNIVFEGTTAELEAADDVRQRYLGVSE
ncbi:ABC transporter ATP-binding protein [Halobacterium wangiae]|uniref:ABC transporter ATP-binding protein n=1 Tax=Halobacterium wangiae TaxID=2902623 RepID=UPI001E3E5F93|nr:ABC transporter ATP-binding protein [Halobacterium wangiae]